MEVKGSPSKYPFLHLSLHWALDSLQPEVGRQGTLSIGAAVVVVTVELFVILVKVDGAHRFGQPLVSLGCAVLAMRWLMAHQHFQNLPCYCMSPDTLTCGRKSMLLIYQSVEFHKNPGMIKLQTKLVDHLKLLEQKIKGTKTHPSLKQLTSPKVTKSRFQNKALTIPTNHYIKTSILKVLNK